MRRRSAPALIVLAILALLFPSCEREEPHTENELVLGTLVTITSYREEDRSAVADAFDLIRAEEKVFDRHHEGSELFTLNSEAFSHPVKVGDELFDLIERSIEIAEMTDGAFNPAIGPLVSLWGIGSDHAKVPTDDEIREALALCDYHDIVLDEEAHTVRFLKEGMSIDLGAIAKGYISGKAAELLSREGVEMAIINLGGNVYALGDKGGKPWKVGLQDPSVGRGECFTTVEASDEAVLTSGAYERYYQPVENGPIYHHILDSGTGCPADSDLVSTTIISDDASLADALSTAFFVAGKEKAEELVSLFGVKAVLLDVNGDVIRLGF